MKPQHLNTVVMIGAEVSVSFGIKGRAYTYTDKKDQVTERTGYSVRLNAYDIQVVGSVQPAQGVQTAPGFQPAPMQAPTAQMPQRPAAPAYQYPQTQAPQVQQVETDDLPF